MSDALKVFISAVNGCDLRVEDRAAIVKSYTTDPVRLDAYLGELTTLCAGTTTYFPVRLEGGVLVHAPGGVAPRQLTAEEAAARSAAYEAAKIECMGMKMKAAPGALSR